jgi:EAL domain-containing protein (putative c-di-GMP-specific phosphodiesterase class I)
MEFQGHESLIVHVNFSARQLRENSIVDDVAKVLLESRLEPRCLCLEITESVLMQDTENSIRKLEQLRKLGVRVFVDDFGTGYSSLSYLDTLPIDGLKIDKSFVSRMGSGLGESALAVAVIKLSRNIDLQAVAEGIETVEQAERLRELECDLGQGYFFAKPLTAEEIPARLTSSSSFAPAKPGG